MNTSDYQAYSNLWTIISKDITSNIWLETFTYRFTQADIVENTEDDDGRLSPKVIDSIICHLRKLGYQTRYRLLEEKKHELSVIFPKENVPNMHNDSQLDCLAVSTLFEKRKKAIRENQKIAANISIGYTKLAKPRNDVVFALENFSDESIAYIVEKLRKAFRKKSIIHTTSKKCFEINDKVRKYDYILMKKNSENDKCTLLAKRITYRITASQHKLPAK